MPLGIFIVGAWLMLTTLLVCKLLRGGGLLQALRALASLYWI